VVDACGGATSQTAALGNDTLDDSDGRATFLKWWNRQ